jgi:glucose/arabinose dehydrogenase
MFEPRFIVRSLAALALSSFALSSCSGSAGAPPAASGPLQQGTQTASQFPSVGELGRTAAALYVSDFYGKSVFRYVRNPNGTLVTPAGSSLVLSYNPGPIAIGPRGDLYVTDEQNESVDVYSKGATGSAQPTRTLSVPFVPSCVAVSRSGNEFVGGFTNGYVAVYAPHASGSASTIQRIALPDRHHDINGVAVDASGNLFVSDTNEVSEFSTPTTNPTLKRAIVGTGQQSTPSGMAVSNRTGELYVANAGDDNILAYSRSANGKSAPKRTISSTSPALKGPVGVALSKSILYSTSGTSADGPPSVFVFDAAKGSQKPLQVVSGPYLAAPIGVALGP